MFVGPILLHGDGKYTTYFNFFSTVNLALQGGGVRASEFRVIDDVITDSDDQTVSF